MQRDQCTRLYGLTRANMLAAAFANGTCSHTGDGRSQCAPCCCAGTDRPNSPKRIQPAPCIMAAASTSLRPPRPILWVDYLAVETRAEQHRMFGLGEAVHVEVGRVAVEGMAPRA